MNDPLLSSDETDALLAAMQQGDGGEQPDGDCGAEGCVSFSGQDEATELDDTCNERSHACCDGE